MSENMNPHGLRRAALHAAARRRRAAPPVPLPVYVLQGAAGIGFMLCVLWLAGFGS